MKQIHLARVDDFMVAFDDEGRCWARTLIEDYLDFGDWPAWVFALARCSHVAAVACNRELGELAELAVLRRPKMRLLELAAYAALSATSS